MQGTNKTQNVISSDGKGRLLATEYFFFALLAGLFAALTFLFYRQTVRFDGKYISDTIIYAEGGGDVQDMRMIAFVFKMLKSVCGGGTLLIALFMSVIGIATILASYKLIEYLFEREEMSCERWQIQAMSVIALFSGPIYIPNIYEHFYISALPKYAWHSPTQQAMIFFSIIAILMFIKLYDHYLDKIGLKQYIALTATIFLAAWAKPNFVLVFVPVLVIVLFKDFVLRKDYSLWHRFKRAFIMGISSLPGGIFLIILNKLEFSSDGSEGSIAINIGYFLRNCDHKILMTFLSLALIIVVGFCNLNKLRDGVYQILFGIFLFGAGEWLVLVETGARINHGNFGWGRQLGEYILFIGIMVIAVSNFKNKNFMASKPLMRRIYLVAVVILIAGHVISQLVYFAYLLTGGLYRI